MFITGIVHHGFATRLIHVIVTASLRTRRAVILIVRLTSGTEFLLDLPLVPFHIIDRMTTGWTDDYPYKSF